MGSEDCSYHLLAQGPLHVLMKAFSKQALASVRNHTALLNSALYFADPCLPCFGARLRIRSLALYLQTRTGEHATLIQVCGDPPRSARLVRIYPSHSSARVIPRQPTWYPIMSQVQYGRTSGIRYISQSNSFQAEQITCVRVALAHYNKIISSLVRRSHCFHESTTNLRHFFHIVMS